MFVTIKGQRIFFDVVGAKLAIDGRHMREKPTLLVLHGGPGFDHTGFRPGLDAMSDIAQVVFLDHRGNGRSVPSDPTTWTLERWGDDIYEFCQALGIEKPFVLGQSFGGMVAQSYATRHPGHAGAIILSSTAARMDFNTSFAIFEKKGGVQAREIAERFWSVGDDTIFDTYMRICMPLYNTTVPVDGENARARATMRQEVYRHFSLPGCEIHTMDFRTTLHCIDCPVLVLGGADDPITPPHLAQEILSALRPGIGTLQIFEDCGHGAFRDKPAQVFDVIRDFLGKL
jgi:proline iminopeptidase